MFSNNTNKMINKIYHTVGTVPRLNRNIVERGVKSTPLRHTNFQALQDCIFQNIGNKGTAHNHVNVI